MAGITANVVNGKLEYDYTDSSKNQKTQGSDLGYDQFLQLLCAEMQYQDPLEPTNNTDYVAQLATFSQLEATLGMQKTTENTMANDLVGKQVILKVTDSGTGTTKYVDGQVDYIMYQDGKTYLSVNNALYPLEDLDTVTDEKFYNAMANSKTFSNMVKLLPELENVTTAYKDLIQSASKFVDDLSDYEKGYIDQNDLTKLKTLETRLNELLKVEEEQKTDQDSEQVEDTEETEKVEETDKTEGTE